MKKKKVTLPFPSPGKTTLTSFLSETDNHTAASGSIKVIVEEVPLSQSPKIGFKPSACGENIVIGEPQWLTLTITDSNGQEVSSENAVGKIGDTFNLHVKSDQGLTDFYFESSDTSVLTVLKISDQAAEITLHRGGEAVIQIVQPGNETYGYALLAQAFIVNKTTPQLMYTPAKLIKKRSDKDTRLLRMRADDDVYRNN